MAYVFTVIGGDARQRKLIPMLLDEGCKVNVIGLSDIEDSRINLLKTLNRKSLDCHVLLLPIPYKNREGNINISDTSIKICLKDIMRNLGDTKPLIILGKGDEAFVELADMAGIDYYDVVEDETFAIFNAIPTAEGAIQRAMELMDITIHGSRALVLGYGRIGKSLSRMLKGIGAQVTVVARKKEDLAWIIENGYKALPFWELKEGLSYQDIIFNTIPKLILDKEGLELIKKDAIIIDLASSPGGTDFQEAKKMGIRATLEPGLPGIVAPKTAASIIHRIIMDCIDMGM